MRDAKEAVDALNEIVGKIYRARAESGEQTHSRRLPECKIIGEIIAAYFDWDTGGVISTFSASLDAVNRKNASDRNRQSRGMTIR